MISLNSFAGSIIPLLVTPVAISALTTLNVEVYGWVALDAVVCLVKAHSHDTLSLTMFDVILYQPEIPPNTGNIIRLCANTGVRLHLVKPLGFSLKDKQLTRAGLDYHEFAAISVYDSWAECVKRFADSRLFAVSTRGTQRYDVIPYAKNDVFLFGPESRGLPAELLQAMPERQRIRLPMRPGSRSLNLSNTVAVIVYEAWRQIGFDVN